ncbi:hypothetical protein B0H17DRAFT_1210490 [Mycena rosella]|uniref:Uncharacterized protein n=1 Tax=Mycena rosella TaxID=1033263 RepID=A0AAD7D036_MYCRO|nr:hypothetical protein B0H17DRAFT_1210490 [Mycena rosella]
MTSRPSLAVPPELWLLVAKSSSRQALARLCTVSRQLHAIFSPLLYGKSTTEPPLLNEQAARLIEMLAEAQRPDPALLIKRLVVPADGVRAQACLAALSRLFDGPGGGQSVRGSALRALKWDNMSLKEISVQCSNSSTRFDFLRIPNLEKIEASLTVERNYKLWRPPFDALSAELTSLPSSSPRLHTLKLKLSMYDQRRSSVPSPWAAYADLLAAINQLVLTALATLELSINVGNVDPRPNTDFSPLLRAHPHLANLTLHVWGTHIPAPSDIAPFLPRLRTFKGDLKHCAAVAARARALEHLFVLIHQNLTINLLELFPPGTAPTVTRLNARAVDFYSNFASFPPQFDPSAFPNLTHLDANINKEMHEYTASLVALVHLKYLCLWAYTYLAVEEWHRPAKEVFPVATYAGHISAALLPVLPQPAYVRLVLLGDRTYPVLTESESDCDEIEDREPERGDLKAEYQFWVRRTGSEGELVIAEDVEDEASE